MKIAFVGDIALIGRFTTRNNNIYEYLKPLKLLLEKYDLIVANLEAPFICADLKPHGFKSAHLYSDSENIAILKFLNINLVSLANNHIYDYGIEGVKSTISVLEQNDINYYGVFNKDYIHTIDGVNVLAFHGYCCYSTNAFKLNSVVDKLSKGTIQAKLEKYQSQNITSIISCHFGNEHVHYPSNDHRLFFKELALKYDFILHGHHPHVIQGYETLKDSTLFYSLGNFMFDDLNSVSHLEKECRVKFIDIHKESLVIGYDTDTKIFDINNLFWGSKSIQFQVEDIFNRLNLYCKSLKIKEPEYTLARTVDMKNNLKLIYSDNSTIGFVKRFKFNKIIILLSMLKNKCNYKKSIK